MEFLWLTCGILLVMCIYYANKANEHRKFIELLDSAEEPLTPEMYIEFIKMIDDYNLSIQCIRELLVVYENDFKEENRAHYKALQMDVGQEHFIYKLKSHAWKDGSFSRDWTSHNFYELTPEKTLELKNKMYLKSHGKSTTGYYAK